MPELAVILATYNEADNLERLVEALESLATDLQLVVVDDNSPDGTGLIAQQLSTRFGNITLVNRPAKLGLGSALQSGLAVALNAGAQYVITMDADLSHDPADVPGCSRLSRRVAPTWSKGAVTRQVGAVKAGTLNAGC